MRYWKESDLGVILLFDSNGFIAGIQAAVRQTYILCLFMPSITLLTYETRVNYLQVLMCRHTLHAILKVCVSEY